jgi:ketosteroid isomerase-like protein
MTMTQPVPRSTVEAFYRAYATRDVEKIAPFLADDVEWTISGPVGVLSFCGTCHGKAAVLDLIGNKVPAVFRVFSFVPEDMLVDGDRACALSRLAARGSEDGRVISYRVANFFRFRDGKLVENRSLMDSFDAVEQVLGHPLAVHSIDRIAVTDLMEVIDEGDLVVAV